MTYRVIQWATGNVGRAAIEGVVNHPDLELVGAYVYSDQKAGRDVGEVCGLGPLGVTATNDVEEILALDADCVVYSPMLASPPEVVRLLESGKNVVTPVGWVYPFRTHDLTAIEAACRQGDASLHGTGINPGGITEQLPLVLSAFCTERPRRSGRGVLRHPHLRHRVRRARRDAVRPHARREREQPDAVDPRRRVLPVDRHGRRRARRHPRRREAHHARDGGDDRAARHAGRRDRSRHRGRPALHVGGHRRRSPVRDRAGELVDGRGTPRPTVDVRPRR